MTTLVVETQYLMGMTDKGSSRHGGGKAQRQLYEITGTAMAERQGDGNGGSADADQWERQHHGCRMTYMAVFGYGRRRLEPSE